MNVKILRCTTILSYQRKKSSVNGRTVHLVNVHFNQIDTNSEFSKLKLELQK